MKKGLREFFGADGASQRVTLRYWSPGVEAGWTIDDQGDNALQIVYRRKDLPPTFQPSTGTIGGPTEEEFWLYLHPDDAAVIGRILLAYARANGAA